jgi:hypothetical protein
MMKTSRFFLKTCAAVLLAAAVGSAQAATYNYVILGDVDVGDETFGFNAWDLTAGDVISATGTFTAELGGTLTGTVNFALGDTMTIDLLGGQYLTEADSVGGISLTFANGLLTDLVFVQSPFDFNSNFTSFDDGDGLSVFGTWQSNASLTVVPVPAAAWLFGSALAMTGWLRRKSAA